MSSVIMFDGVTWPEQMPTRLFRFSPLALHELCHHGYTEQRDQFMEAGTFYHDEWSDDPWALIAWPDEQADELAKQMDELIGSVEEFVLTGVEGDQPTFTRGWLEQSADDSFSVH